MDPRFAHVRDWIFDLDNSLYPASTGLFALIDVRMGAYIQRLLGCDRGRGAAGAEGAFPRPRHDPRRADEASMASTRTTSSTDVHDIPLDRIAATTGWSAGARPAARPQVRLHQRRRALCPPGARPARPRRRASTASTTSTPWTMCPSPTRTAMRLMCERFGIDPARALFVEDMARNLVAGQGARHDHRLGRQWLRARQPRRRCPTLSTTASPISATGSRRSWRTSA